MNCRGLARRRWPRGVQKLAGEFAPELLASGRARRSLAEKWIFKKLGNHVLEHAYDPAGLLRQLRALVHPGGHVLVATPNLAGAAMRWKTLLSRLGLKARPFRHLDYPKHLVLFDRGNLRRLVEAAGLEVLAVESCTRASSDASSRPRRARLWGSLGLGDNMFVLARRPDAKPA